MTKSKSPTLTRPFEPIAIVGQSCVLPGALDPESLWHAVEAGKDLVSAVPEDRWGLSRRHAMTPSADDARDRTWCDRGGYVRDFDAIFDADGFGIDADEIRALDPLFQWVLHTGREALRDAGLHDIDPTSTDFKSDRAKGAGERTAGPEAHGTERRARTGVVLGNLSFPSAETNRFAESHWLSQAGLSIPGENLEAPGENLGSNPKNRFSSGLPAHLLAHALNLDGGAFSLDAACASSLYALKLACDRLHDRNADLMLAGAVSCADDLFIHIGFCALEAMSASGRSRPFHRSADGLLPAEGAAFVALERLDDAIRNGRKIHGVIRGIGLSNDGRGRSLLAPSQEGQVRAIRRAYAQSGWDPADVSLVECHATGTPVGDATEIGSLTEVYEGLSEVPVGSLKSNLGHLITAAGIAGLIKVLGAMKARVRPPTLHVDDPNPALEGSPFRLLNEAEPWQPEGLRRAALSAFGFGGNNAHLLVEEYVPLEPVTEEFSIDGMTQSALVTEELSIDSLTRAGLANLAAGARKTSKRQDIAIVGLAVIAGNGDDVTDFESSLFGRRSEALLERADGSQAGITGDIELPFKGLRFPPKDLKQTLPQQLMLLEAAQHLPADLTASLPRDTTGVLIGTQCDAEIARYGLRWRLSEWVERWREAGFQVDDEWLTRAQDASVAGLQAAGVVGTMPNIPANRLNNQLDLGGPSATFSAEELSGLVALELATRALRAGDMDAALVGAVDLSCEPVHEAAARELLPANRQTPGDAAVLLVLRRLEDARRDGQTVLAVLDDVSSGSPGFSGDLGSSGSPGSSGDLGSAGRPTTTPRIDTDTVRFGPDLDTAEGINLTARFGHAHAASGLLHVAAAVLACKHRTVPATHQPGRPWLARSTRKAHVEVSSSLGNLQPQWASAQLSEAPHDPEAGDSVNQRGPVSWPRFQVIAGSDRAEILHQLHNWELTADAEAPTNESPSPSVGPSRLVLVGDDDQALAARRKEAIPALEALAADATSLEMRGIHFRERPLRGELGFVFTGAAAAYPGMGRELMLATPELHTPLAERMGAAASAASWVYDGTADAPDVLHQLWGASYLCQAHAELSRRLGLRPHAAIGYSSGESNSLMALGPWNDLEGLYRDTLDGGIFTRELCGPMAAVGRFWDHPEDSTEPIAWSNWIVRAPAESVRKALEGESRVYLTLINSPNEVVIGGQSDATARVLAKLDAQVYPLGYPMAVHSPEVDAVREAWLELHRRETSEVDNIRFYTHADGGRSYRPDRESAAQAILGQALGTIDFPSMVKKAWDDGVRIFVEHGPRGLCSRWIQESLDAHGIQRDTYLAVSWDSLGLGNIHHSADTVASLLAAGLDLDHRSLWDRVGLAVQSHDGPSLSFPAHWPPVELPSLNLSKTAEASTVTASTYESPSATESTNAPVRVEALPRNEPLSSPEPSPVVSPSVVSPNVVSPNVVSPNVVSPNVVSPSVVSPDVVSPAADSPLATASPSIELQMMAPAPSLPSVFFDPPEASAISTHPTSATDPAAPRAETRSPQTKSFNASLPETQLPGPSSVPAAAATILTQASKPVSEATGVSTPALVAPVAAVLQAPDPPQAQVGAQHAKVGAQQGIAELAMAGMADLQARLATAQRSFLAQQNQLHRQFLELRQRDLERLGQALSNPLGMSSPSSTSVSLTAAEVAPVSVVMQTPLPSPIAPAVPRNGNGAAIESEPISPATPTIAAVSAVAASVVDPRPKPQSPSKATASAATAAAQVPSQPRAVAQKPMVVTPSPEDLPGPKIDRQGLLTLASGNISEIFGPLFEGQDQYHRQVRMPEPPFLFADRVTGIKGEPRKLGTGTIWTETDVTEDSWYLYRGRMPGGLMIEAGQADLLLISWQGIDFLNKSERVYRLLGCELTYRGELPRIGDTLKYEIHIDGHAKQGDVRLFFFHYDCHIDGQARLEVRGGQAGFFTDAELAESAGVLWDAKDVELKPGRVDPPPTQNMHRSFTREQLVAFSEGRVYDCMGAGFEMAAGHTLSPAVQSEHMLLLDQVSDFDPTGGPWGRGYLRATTPVSPEEWIYEGHFHNDPCMPGTLMFEGCLQTMAFYMAAMGFTIERDGWRFQPVADIPYPMRCRGQVDPTSKELVYEVFVREVWDAAEPTLFADLLVTVDGLKAFHAEGVGLRLVPDWPMLTQPSIVDQPFPGGERPTGRPVAEVDGFRFDYPTLLACAWGKPSHAFGDMYSRFDGPRTVARLPGPPYHFMSRIAKIDGEMGVFQPGAKIVTEYDVAPGQWYFSENGYPTMPYAVLLEAGLQPCGWLASFIGSALTADIDLQFRNLDGTATQTADILPSAGTLRTEVHLTATSASAGVMIVRFEVEMFAGEQPVFNMKTAFGFFPKAAMASQAGLPAAADELEIFEAPSDFHVDLVQRPAKYFDGAARIGSHKMLVLDRVTGYWPEAGKAGLGRMRAEKTVDPGEWFFKAHFFQDPVQPGSLGIEAMIQLLQIYMLERGLHEKVPGGRFEAIAIDRPMTWKYRGQVIPKNHLISSQIEVTEVGEDERGVFAVAEAYLWVDGKRIYSAVELGMRIVPGTDGPIGTRQPSDSSPAGTQDGGTQDGDTEDSDTEDSDTEETALVPIATDDELEDTGARIRTAKALDALAEAESLDDTTPAIVMAKPVIELELVEDDYPVPANPDEEILSPERDPWLDDHCPTWTLPALPMMSMVDRLAAAAIRRHPSLQVVGLEEVQVRRWIAFPGGPVRLRTEIESEEPHKSGAVTLTVALKIWRESPRPELSRFETAAGGKVWLAPGYGTPPAPLPDLHEVTPADDPYDSGALFHGPAFQLLKGLSYSKAGSPTPGSTAVLDAAAGTVPWGALHQALLDAATHGIPHDAMHRWSSDIPEGFAAYPSKLDAAHFFGPPPTDGPVRCEARFEGLLTSGVEGQPPAPVTRLQLIADDRVWADLLLREVLLPKGRLGAAPAPQRRAFLRDRVATPGVGLSQFSANGTHLSEAELAASDWLAGTVARAYGASVEDRFALTREVAIKDHIGRHTGNHPALIDVELATASAVAAGQPLTRYAVEVAAGEQGELVVTDQHPPTLDVKPLSSYWRGYFRRQDTWAVEDIYYGLIERYVRRVVLTHPEEFKAVHGRTALFLANHQVGVESLLFSTLASALIGKPTVTLAKDQHRTTWLGLLIKHCFSYPGMDDPGLITFFERDNPRSLPKLIRKLGERIGAGERAVMVHSEGTRSLTCRKPVELVSGSFIDMAMKNGAPIIPVRFTGGLPAEPLEERIEFPIGHGQQDYWFGKPILPEELEPMRYRDRRDFVLEAMNAVGPDQSQELPFPGRPQFAGEVEEWIERTGASPEHAAIYTTLEHLENPGPEAQRILEAAQTGTLRVDATEQGQWLAELARRLYGERGPKIRVI